MLVYQRVTSIFVWDFPWNHPAIVPSGTSETSQVPKSPSPSHMISLQLDPNCDSIILVNNWISPFMDCDMPPKKWYIPRSNHQPTIIYQLCPRISPYVQGLKPLLNDYHQPTTVSSTIIYAFSISIFWMVKSPLITTIINQQLHQYVDEWLNQQNLLTIHQS